VTDDACIATTGGSKSVLYLVLRLLDRLLWTGIGGGRCVLGLQVVVPTILDLSTVILVIYVRVTHYREVHRFPHNSHD
jgi:hypothetical protein